MSADDLVAPDEGWVRLPQRLPGLANTGALRNSRMREFFASILGSDFKQRTFGNTPRPSVWDWRTQGVVTAPGAQEPLQACVSYAACAVADARLRIAKRSPPLLSPRSTHLCALGLEPDQGTNPISFAARILKTGVPYTASPDKQPSSRSECAGTAAAGFLQVRSFYEFGNMEEVKREIHQFGPVIAHMALEPKFHEWFGGGVYRSTTTGSFPDHAVCLIGYNDKEQYWIGKNSRGTAWGEGGFFRLGYGSCDVLGKYRPAYSFDT